ncbi:hypothetical protein HK102_005461 [Quaeritorhiza haematococci]|nr:hypothetical protein HK102_005461 [Quaeritorhiza haematococci]
MDLAQITDTPLFYPTIASLGYFVLVAYGLFARPSQPNATVPKLFLVLYNGFQVIFNGYIVYNLLTNALRYKGFLLFNVEGIYWPVVSRGIYLHYIAKYLDIIDTIIIIAKGPTSITRQLSFLHIYHHFSIIWCWYYVHSTKFLPESWFGAAMNSFVHCIMYGYYLCSTLNIRVPTPIKKSITRLQQTQFMIVSVQSVATIWWGREEKAVGAWLQLVEMQSLFGLFWLWSRGAYRKGKGDVNGSGDPMLSKKKV